MTTPDDAEPAPDDQPVLIAADGEMVLAIDAATGEVKGSVHMPHVWFPVQSATNGTSACACDGANRRPSSWSAQHSNRAKGNSHSFQTTGAPGATRNASDHQYATPRAKRLATS